MPMKWVRLWTRLAALALSLAAATPAFAQTWQQVSSDANATYYVDKASVAREGRFLTVTSRTDYIGAGIEKGVVRRVYNEVFDCGRPAVKLRKLTLFGADGSVLNEFEWGDDEFDWIEFGPGSLGAKKADAICG